MNSFPRVWHRSSGFWIWLTLAAVVSACADVPELNSERIQRRFGSYGVDLLAQTETLRIANLYTMEDAQRTCRTLAVVRFAPDATGHFPTADRDIRAGGSIGATLERYGWRVDKATLYLGQYEPPVDAALLLHLMHLERALPLALHAYELRASHPSRGSHAYATILELHHPEHWTVEDLRSTYESATTDPLSPARWAEFLDLTNRIVRGVFM